MKEIPFKTGMIYRSKIHPQFDLIIDYVSYYYKDNGSVDNDSSIVCWCSINRAEFNKFCETHCKSKDSTFPYPYSGECKPHNIKQRLKKYNLEYIEMSDDKVNIYNNNQIEYSSGFEDCCSKLSQ